MFAVGSLLLAELASLRHWPAWLLWPITFPCQPLLRSSHFIFHKVFLVGLTGFCARPSLVAIGLMQAQPNPRGVPDHATSIFQALWYR
jgi:hypothetical protein